MIKRRWITALCTMHLLVASSALAAPMQFGFLPGSTLQMGAGPVEVLTGGLAIECPLQSCVSFGDVDFDIVSINLQSTSFSETGSGPFVPVMFPDGTGFSIGRTLTLMDAGSIGIPPQKDASLAYGFDAETLSSSPTLERYRVWILRGPGMYTGAFVPNWLSMQLVLEETIIEWRPQQPLSWVVAQTAQVAFTATPVPEPSTALLLGIGLVGLAVVRRAQRIE